MPASYKKINYSIRPAKSIERKMLSETLRKLTVFNLVENYRYVGFGSTYFSDFTLFHKTLGIHNMVSIEKDTNNKARFEFNKPFNCVKMEFGGSNDILPKLNWSEKTILWLDYDTKLDATSLADISYFCAFAPASSVLIVTVNAQPDEIREGEDPNTYRLQELKRRVGEEKVPLGVTGRELRAWDAAKVYRRIICNEIKETLMHRNGGLHPSSKLNFKQIFNFHYSDGAKMLTLGGLIFEEGQKALVAGCGFENLPFTREDSEPYLIEVPNLTYNEIRHLNTKLPTSSSFSAPTHNIPQEDIENYAKTYRWFPNFAETEM